MDRGERRLVGIVPMSYYWWLWKWHDDCLIVSSFFRVLLVCVCWKLEQEIDSFVSALVGAGPDLEGSVLFLFFAMSCLVASILFGWGSCSS